MNSRFVDLDTPISGIHPEIFWTGANHVHLDKFASQILQKNNRIKGFVWVSVFRWYLVRLLPNIYVGRCISIRLPQPHVIISHIISRSNFCATWSLIPSKTTVSDLWNQYFFCLPSLRTKYFTIQNFFKLHAIHFIPEDHTPFNGPAEDMDFKSCRRRCVVCRCSVSSLDCEIWLLRWVPTFWWFL